MHSKDCHEYTHHQRNHTFPIVSWWEFTVGCHAVWLTDTGETSHDLHKWVFYWLYMVGAARVELS
jgi:hypothetical protein